MDPLCLDLSNTYEKERFSKRWPSAAYEFIAGGSENGQSQASEQARAFTPFVPLGSNLSSLGEEGTYENDWPKSKLNEKAHKKTFKHV